MVSVALFTYMRGLIWLLAFMVCGCTIKNEKTADSEEIPAGQYYYDAVSELEQMLVEVCDMADSLRQSGVRLEHIRDSLRTLPRYNALSNRAVGLDSAVLDYMDSRDSDSKLRKRYNLIVSRYSKRVKSVGLD